MSYQEEVSLAVMKNVITMGVSAILSLFIAVQLDHHFHCGDIGTTAIFMGLILLFFWIGRVLRVGFKNA